MALGTGAGYIKSGLYCCALCYTTVYTRARARARHMTQKKPSGHSKLLLLLQLYDEEEEEEEEEGKMAAAEQYQGQFFQSWFLVRSDFTAFLACFTSRQAGRLNTAAARSSRIITRN